LLLLLLLLSFWVLAASWNPGHLASRGWSCRDAGQHGANPGHPGKSGTGGNPNQMCSMNYWRDVRQPHVLMHSQFPHFLVRYCRVSE